MVALFGGRGSLRQVRVCDECKIQQRLHVHHRPDHRGLNAHRDGRHLNRLSKVKGTYVRDKFYRLTKLGAGTSGQSLLSPTRSWWPSITCFPTKSATTNWAIFTSISSTGIP